MQNSEQLNQGRVWLDLSHAMIARERLGMTPEVDGTRNPDQVASTLASFAGEIQQAGRAGDADRYYNLLIEAAAECLAAADAQRRAEQAAARDTAAAGGKSLAARAADRRKALRREIDGHAATRRFSATPGAVPALAGRPGLPA